MNYFSTIKQCEEMSNDRVSGNLCMDLCVQKSIDIPACSEDKFCPNPYYSVILKKNYYMCLRIKA